MTLTAFDIDSARWRLSEDSRVYEEMAEEPSIVYTYIPQELSQLCVRRVPSAPLDRLLQICGGGSSNLNNQYTRLVKDKSQLRSLTTLVPLLIYWEELQKEWLIGVTFCNWITGCAIWFWFTDKNRFIIVIGSIIGLHWFWFTAKSWLIRVICSGIGLHCLHCMILIHWNELTHRSHSSCYWTTGCAI